MRVPLVRSTRRASTFFPRLEAVFSRYILRGEKCSKRWYSYCTLIFIYCIVSWVHSVQWFYWRVAWLKFASKQHSQSTFLAGRFLEELYILENYTTLHVGQFFGSSRIYLCTSTVYPAKALPVLVSYVSFALLFVYSCGMIVLPVFFSFEMGSPSLKRTVDLQQWDRVTAQHWLLSLTASEDTESFTNNEIVYVREYFRHDGDECTPETFYTKPCCQTLERCASPVCNGIRHLFMYVWSHI